jgi:magnesium transporter
VPGILARQAGVGVLNGLVLAVAASLLTFFLLSGEVFHTSSSPGTMAAVVAIAALMNLTIGSVAGSGIPLLLRSLGQDPALASSIFLTLITDLVGFGGFLLVAVLLL